MVFGAQQIHLSCRFLDSGTTEKVKPHDSSLKDVEGQSPDDDCDVEIVELLMSQDHFSPTRVSGLRGRAVSTDRREDLMGQRQEILTTSK